MTYLIYRLQPLNHLLKTYSFIVIFSFWLIVLNGMLIEDGFSQTKPVTKISKEEKELLKKAETSFTEGKYNFALKYYLRLIKANETNIQYAYAIGICYLNLTEASEKVKSIEYFIKVVDNPYGIVDACYYLGLAYQIDHQFDKAIMAFNKYIGRLKETDIDLINEAKRQIEICNNSRYFLENQVDVDIINLGPKINSRFSDYTPVISADESIIIFTSRRKGATGNQIFDYDEYYEDIYISINNKGVWSKAEKIDKETLERLPPIKNKKKKDVKDNYIINTPTHDAAIGLSADGQKLFVYRSDERKWGDIYMCKLLGKDWSAPLKLGENINSKYWEGHASLSGDENELYFSSNRPGGYGGKDIYRSKRIPGGEWGTPKNLGPVINTPYDEDAPFIHPDGKTLYFSSSGHKTMGGYDIFVSVLGADGFWSEAKNIGYPINTMADDIYFVLSANGKRGYFSSARPGGYGNQDIYVVEMPSIYEQQPVLTLMKGIIKACDQPIEAEIIVLDNETEKIQGKYTSNAVTGKYIIAIPSGNNYNITIKSEGYLFQSENIYFPAQDKFLQINKDIDLLCGELGDRVCLNNIFFTPGNSTILDQSNVELDQIFNFMLENPSLIMMIKTYLFTEFGHLDQNVAQNRAIAIVNYLTKKGIDPNRLIAEGVALDSNSTRLSLNNKVCLEMVGGHLGTGTKPVTNLAVDDELYKKTVIYCGEKEIKKLTFRVQIGAYRDPRQVNFTPLKEFKRIRKEIFSDGITRFTVGTYKQLKNADIQKNKIIKQGILDTWVVPYYKNKRINMKKVLEMCIGEVNINVKGNVTEKELNIPISDVKITILNNTYKDQHVIKSDKDGKFICQLIPGSNFLIIGSKIGFKSDTISISTSGSSVSETISLTLHLKNLKKGLNDDIQKFHYYFKAVAIDEITEQPLINFKIILTDLTSNTSEQIQNFNESNFNFILKPASKYILKASKDNYLTKSIPISTIGNLYDTTDFTLKLRKIIPDKEVIIKDITFEPNKTEVNDLSLIEIEKFVQLLKDNPKIKIELCTHTDSKGDDDMNLLLSQKRAEYIASLIESKGISGDRIFPKGYGERLLLNDCKNGIECDERKHKQNRRVSYKIIGLVKD